MAMLLPHKYMVTFYQDNDNPCQMENINKTQVLLLTHAKIEMQLETNNELKFIQNMSSNESKYLAWKYKAQRHRGGSLKGESNGQSIISIAIRNAIWHGIKLHHGGYNNADGNCIFESIVQNVNSRPCFGEYIPGSADLHRQLWLSERETLVWKFTGG